MEKPHHPEHENAELLELVAELARRGLDVTSPAPDYREDRPPYVPTIELPRDDPPASSAGVGCA